MNKKPVVLMILDGYGLNEKTNGNAVAIAKTPVIDGLMEKYPFVKGNASGMAVGLPDGQMGNSEVGHLNMGAGRIVYQELTRITKEIQDGDFFENEALLTACRNAKENGTALHMFGLLSDGGVHSHNTHLYGLLELAKRNGLEKVYVHAFLDGRDTPPASAKGFVEQMEAKMEEIGVGRVASVTGRYYAMDRDNRWDRVELAYKAITAGVGEEATDAVQAIADSYAKDVTDEFVVPTVITKNGAPIATVNDGDSVVFFNFRPDRAREITRTFVDDNFDGFEREKIKDLKNQKNKIDAQKIEQAKKSGIIHEKLRIERSKLESETPKYEQYRDGRAKDFDRATKEYDELMSDRRKTAASVAETSKRNCDNLNTRIMQFNGELIQCQKDYNKNRHLNYNFNLNVCFFTY